MAASTDLRNAPTIVPPACALQTEAQEMRSRATDKRVLATRLLKEAEELDRAAALKEKRSHE